MLLAEEAIYSKMVDAYRQTCTRWRRPILKTSLVGNTASATSELFVDWVWVVDLEEQGAQLRTKTEVWSKAPTDETSITWKHKQNNWKQLLGMVSRW